MSLKEFLENNTVNTLGSTLPIPYMESVVLDVEDGDYILKIKSTIFIHVNAESFKKDEGDEYLSYLNNSDLKTYCVLAFDRNSDLEAYGLKEGVTFGEAASGAESGYMNWPINGYTDITTGDISPLKCVLRGEEAAGSATFADDGSITFSSQRYEITTLFNTPSINNSWMRATLLYLMDVAYHSGEAGRYTIDLELPLGDYASSTDDSPTFNIEEGTGNIGGSMVGLGDIYELSDLTENPDEYEDAEYYQKLLAIAENPLWAEALNNLLAQIITKQSDTFLKMMDVWLYPESYTSFSQKFYTEYGSEYVTIYLNLDPELNATRSHTIVEVPHTVFDLGDISEYSTLDDTIYHSDGSVTYKKSNNITLNSSDTAGELYFPDEILNPDTFVGASAIGLASFSTSLDLTDEEVVSDIFESYQTLAGDSGYYESFVSPLNYVTLFRNEEVATDPIEVFTDDNGKYHESAILSLSGLYYAETSIKLENIVESIASIVIPTSMDSDLVSGLRYILARYGQSEDLLPQLNIYRRTFPDKSTVTPMGQFYNAFAGLLYDSNTIIERGTLVSKNLVTNPVVRDFRFNVDDIPTITNRTSEGYDLDKERKRAFDISKSIWSRYTSIVDIDAEIRESRSGEMGINTPGEDGDQQFFTTSNATGLGGATYYDGGHFDYNFADEGFIFFNYEKALKEDSFLAEIMSVAAFENYFGQKLTNAAYKVKRAEVNAVWGGHAYKNSDGSRYEPGDGTDDIDLDFSGDTKYIIGSIVLIVTYQNNYPESLCNLYEHRNVIVGGLLEDIDVDDSDLIESDHFSTFATIYPLDTEDGPASEISRYFAQPDGVSFDSSVFENYVESYTSVDEAEDAYTTSLSNQNFFELLRFAEDDVNLATDLFRAGLSTGGITTLGSPRSNPAYGGAEFMAEPIRFSSLTLRGWSPPTNTEGSYPLRFDTSVVTDEDLFNRIMCFNYKKNDLYNGFDARYDSAAELTDEISLLTSQKNENIYFTSKLLVEDKTYDLFLEIWSLVGNISVYLDDYIEAAEDYCSYNPAGYFNEHFVSAMNERYAVEHEAPWYKAAIMYHIFLDIFHGEYNGDVALMTEAVKADVYNLRPDTGNLDSITHFKEKYDDLFTGQLKDFVSEDLGGSEDGTTYASTIDDKKYICFGSGANSAIDGEEQFNTYEFNDLWKPSEVYDNFPLYPSSEFSAELDVSGGDVPDDTDDTEVVLTTSVMCWDGSMAPSFADCPPQEEGEELYDFEIKEVDPYGKEDENGEQSGLVNKGKGDFDFSQE